MNRASAQRVVRFCWVPAILLLVAGTGTANARITAPKEAPTTLNAIDFNFVGQANLGAPFQVDSGRLAEAKGTTAAIRDYAHLMVTSHIPVVDACGLIDLFSLRGDAGNKRTCVVGCSVGDAGQSDWSSPLHLRHVQNPCRATCANRK